MKIRIIRTNEKRPWTEHAARNRGAEIAKGEYLFFVDADYIVPEETISKALDFAGDRMNIRRRLGILDETGNLKFNDETLRKLKVKPRWIKRKYVPGHRSQFLIRKELFWRLGGYNEALDGQWRRTGGAGEKFWRKWQKAERKGKAKTATDTLEVFMFPDKRWCSEEPKNLFHELPRT